MARKVAASQAEEFRDAATILIRYRIYPIGILRHTQKAAREMFARDLREVGKRSFPGPRILLQILGHFPPRRLMARPNTNDPAYEEFVIPERMREFPVSLSGIGSFRETTHEMANSISFALARGRSKVPSYTPFFVPDVSAAS